jgi:hypothetical protein
MKLYAGERRKDGTVKVIVWDDVSFGMKYARYTRLDARPDLVEDASAGFDWGRPGAGASALAAAILADCLGEQAARLHHRAFAREVVQQFGPDRWKLGEGEVADVAERLPGATGRPQPSVAPRPAPAAEPEHAQLASLAAWLAGNTRPARFRPAVRVG